MNYKWILAGALTTAATVAALFVARAALVETTPPAITLGLADPASFTSVLPIPADGNVSPDSKGLIKFRAKLTDEGSGVVSASIRVPGGSGAMHSSPTPRGFVGAAWDTRTVADGASGTVRVSATDAAGNQASQTVVVTVTREGVRTMATVNQDGAAFADAWSAGSKTRLASRAWQQSGKDTGSLLFSCYADIVVDGKVVMKSGQQFSGIITTLQITAFADGRKEAACDLLGWITQAGRPVSPVTFHALIKTYPQGISAKSSYQVWFEPYPSGASVPLGTFDVAKGTLVINT